MKEVYFFHNLTTVSYRLCYCYQLTDMGYKLTTLLLLFSI